VCRNTEKNRHVDEPNTYVMTHCFEELTSWFQLCSLLEGASGLGCNIAKCQLVPFRCDEAQVELATSMFPCQLMEFH
jgi:hypothetical protein